MELDKIELLLEKYFQGESTIAEENKLRNYFSSSDVAQHLEQYQPLFGYFSQAKKQTLQQDNPRLSIVKTKKRALTWISIAASVVILLGMGTFAFLNLENKSKKTPELGTYDDPKVALRETQKALALLSNHVNVGIESVQYIQEFENSKNKIFNQ